MAYGLHLRTSDEVKEKVVVAQETELKINETSEFYRPTGARGSLLFFQLMSLCNMHTFYKYSLDAYLMVVTRAVNSVTLRKPKEVKEEVKVEETTEAEGGEDEEGEDEEAEVEEAAVEEEEEEEIIELTGKDLKLRVDLRLAPTLHMGMISSGIYIVVHCLLSYRI